MNAAATMNFNTSPQSIEDKLSEYTRIYSLEAIPQELKAWDQWILWKADYIPEKDKVNKIPVNPKNYRNASSTDPGTWTSFEEAIRALKPGYGLGFVLTTDDGVTGIDIDNCIHNGVIEAWAYDLITEIDSYTEISPSGTGIRIFAEAAWLAGGNRKGQLEVYTQGRFLTVTGNHMKETPGSVEKRQEVINLIHNSFFPQNTPAEKSKPVTLSICLSNAELIRIASKSKQGSEFKRLMAGDWQGAYESQSQADQAFCNMLAFWTGKNTAQIDSIVRESGLYRPKWDEMHGAQTYGEMTISKAIADTRDVFQPNRRSAQEDFSKPAYFDDQGTFIPAWLAEDIMKEYLIKYAAGEFWIYKGGVYRPGADQTLERIAQAKLGSATRTSRIKETLDYIKRETYSDLPKAQCGYVNVQNGRLNWRTGELFPHDYSLFEIVQLPVIYDPAASCPVFDYYIETTLDKDVIPLVDEILGYCLIPDTKYEKAVMFTGGGRNGKSIYLFVVQELLGKENTANVALQELEENRFRAAELFGKLVNIFADLDQRALKGSSFFKMLVSGDSLTAERKFRDPFSFSNYARLIFSANKLPSTSDTTFAFYERWLIIPFDKTFDVNNPATDPDLRVKLSTPEELSGILNRALAGLQRLYFAGRFTEPASVRAALNEYRRQNDSVMAFCEDCVDPAQGRSIAKEDFYNSYKIWCEKQGLRPVSQKKLKPSLVQVFPHVMDGREGNYGPRVWFDIALNEEAPKSYVAYTTAYDDF
ncbi:MAG: phage/plasmid primase, P4 family [Acidobacteriota bacterium]